jgi:hypothetical protein
MMKSNKSVKKANLDFGVLLICLLSYGILGVFLLQFYQYAINADGISLISIGQKYLKGDFHDAINGYWGPLFSWLLVPFLFLGLKPLLATKILSLILGLFTIIGVRVLFPVFEIALGVRVTILFSMIPMMLYFALPETTPDLLLVCILIYYFGIIFDNRYAVSRYRGILCGALGTASYLSKSFAFPFFISHFLLFNLWHYIKSGKGEKRRAVFVNFFLGILFFSVMSAGWVYLLSDKYGKVTIGTSGRYARALRAPERQDHSMHTQGFLRPPNETAISAWEDPSYFKMKSWSALESLSSFKHQMYLILKYVCKTLMIFTQFSLLSIVIIIASVLLFIKRFDKIAMDSGTIYALVTMILFSGGYTLIYTQERYLWVNYILLLLIGGQLLTILFRRNFFLDNKRKMVAMGLFLISFIVYPSVHLILNINTGKNIYTLSEKIRNMGDIKGNVASNRGYWHYSLFLSYYLNTQYFGEAKQNMSDIDLENDLRNNNIDYYLCWGKNNDNQQFLSEYTYREIIVEGTSNLKIYSLK